MLIKSGVFVFRLDFTGKSRCFKGVIMGVYVGIADMLIESEV